MPPAGLLACAIAAGAGSTLLPDADARLITVVVVLVLIVLRRGGA